MSRVELRCDAERVVHMHAEGGTDRAKCGKLLARSPMLGERVQWSATQEHTGEVWLVDYHRHLACVHVAVTDGIANTLPLDSQTVAWTALRPCNGEPVR